MKKDKRISRATIERIIYILIIIGLVIYGILKDSEAASKLIHSVYEAFTLLLN